MSTVTLKSTEVIYITELFTTTHSLHIHWYETPLPH